MSRFDLCFLCLCFFALISSMSIFSLVWLNIGGGDSSPGRELSTLLMAESMLCSNESVGRDELCILNVCSFFGLFFDFFSPPPPPPPSDSLLRSPKLNLKEGSLPLRFIGCMGAASSMSICSSPVSSFWVSSRIDVVGLSSNLNFNFKGSTFFGVFILGNDFMSLYERD